MPRVCCAAGEDKRKAQAFAFAAVLLAAATTFLLLRISYAQAAFQTTMSKRDEGLICAIQCNTLSGSASCYCTAMPGSAEGFMKAIKNFVLIIIVACPLFAVADWVEQRLTLEWRNWLTSYLLRAYFADRAFFKLKQQAGSLDNPDQVLSESCVCSMFVALQPSGRSQSYGLPGSVTELFPSVELTVYQPQRDTASLPLHASKWYQVHCSIGLHNLCCH